MTDCTAAKQGPGGHAKGRHAMTDCTAAKQGPGGHAKGTHGMTDCTERHPAAPRNGLAGAGQEGMPKAGTA